MPISTKTRQHKKDFKLVINYFKFLKFFSNSTATFKIVYTIVLIIYILLVCLILKHNIQVPRLWDAFFGKLWVVNWTLNALVILYYMVMFPFFTGKTLDDLYENFHELEDRAIGHVLNKNKNLVLRVYIRLPVMYGLIEILFALFFYKAVITPGQFFMIVVLHILDYISIIHIFLINTNITIVTNWLKNKYDSCNVAILKVCKTKQDNFQAIIYEIIEFLDYAHKVIKLYNKLFGIAILFYHIWCVYSVTMWILYSVGEQFTHYRFLNISYPAPYAVSIFYQHSNRNTDNIGIMD